MRLRTLQRVERPRPLRSVEGRVPAHDLLAEKAVLSGAIQDLGAASHAVGVLTPEDFFDTNHARVFEAIAALVVGQQTPEIVSIAGWLTDREWKPPQDGWMAYVTAFLYGTDGAVVYAERWARRVAVKAQIRRIQASCQRFAGEAYFDVEDDEKWIATVESTMLSLARPPQQQRIRRIAEPIREAFTKMTQASEDGRKFTGIPTGYDRLDGKMAGLHEGDLVIVAARPGMGKTSFVLNIATNVASARRTEIPRNGDRPAYTRDEPGYGVCVFSLEMPDEQLAVRSVCSEGAVDLGKVRQNQLYPNDWKQLTEGASYVSSLPIWVDDTPSISVLEIAAKVRRIQAEYNREATDTKPAQKVGMVVIDYLQLMKGRDGVNSREQEISEISRGLKRLAKELKVPVVALSQLNRSVETRSTKDKRPQLSDLRESGAIEQDADTIIFIYRDDYYNPETTDKKGIAELIIAKQRNGATGKVYVRFAASSTRFYNLEPGDYPESDEQ
jgi:replicative DNA helicase